jgi:DNA-binding transcriptional regulator GbsR (MarR family)
MTTEALPEAGRRPAEWQLEFIDRIGASADVSGLPPSYIRVLAWLLVCEPPEQSVEDLRETLGLSAGAVSMATTTLGRMGFVERVARAGDRRLRYRFPPQAFERVIELRLTATIGARAAAEAALENAPRPSPRLEGLRDMYAFFEEGIAEYLRRLRR